MRSEDGCGGGEIDRMAIHVDEKWLREYGARTGMNIPNDEKSAVPKRAKYGNRKTEMDGIEFDSVHEAQIYQELTAEVLAGQYRALFCQVTFTLPGGIRYVADFVTLNNDGTYSVYDAKSVATRKDKAYRLKYRLMKNCLGITIQEV